MKKLLAFLLPISFLLATQSLAGKRPRNPNPVGSGASHNYVAAGTTLAYYSFDSFGVCVPQGWTTADVAGESYFHVDDYAGLGGGTFGNLIPLEGSQSLWCGLRPSVPLCGYATLPGYGNLWNQAFCLSDCISVTGDVNAYYLARWDTEGGYDFARVEFETCTGGLGNEDWTTMRRQDGGDSEYDGVGFTPGDSAACDAIPDSLHSGEVRIRFHFTSDESWSDEDGLWDTDGAISIDSLSVHDGTGQVVATELFEDELVGDTDADDWSSCPPLGYGDFAGLFQGWQQIQEDPCAFDFTCLWGFFNGSTFDYGCGGYPSQSAVPYANASGQYIMNEIWSPEISLAGSGANLHLQFNVYKDLPLDALVFFTWRVRSVVAGCPGAWRDHEYVYYGGHKFWLEFVESIGDLIEPGAAAIQVALGVVDMFPYWGGIYGSGACHSHAPLFDNVSVYSLPFSVGPQWSIRHIDLFQDNFATDGSTTGVARADAAIDVLGPGNPNIQPGDSACVTVDDPDDGLGLDPYTGFGPTVYAYMSVWPQGQPGKTGAGLTSDSFRYPVVDSLLHGGIMWYCIRMDTAFTNGGARTGAQPDRYCIDLNDNLFTPGDTICYVFRAISDSPANNATYYSRRLDGQGVGFMTANQGEALDSPMEFTILPAGGWSAGGDVLYVDHADDRDGPAQLMFDSAFDLLGIGEQVDRYDVLDQSAFGGNSLASRVANVAVQLGCYRKIIWSSGSQERGLIGDGSGQPLKSDDYGLLYTFLDTHPDNPGLYLNGDNLAEEWVGLGGVGAANLRSVFMNFNLATGNHVTTGDPLSPLLFGTFAGCFDHSFDPDTLIALGGCPVANGFDVLSPAGASSVELYNGIPGTGYILSQSTPNSMGTTARVILSGFDFSFIRDYCACPPPARAEHLKDILTWLGNVVGPITRAPSAGLRNYLDSNFPNPFNPTTTIRYGVKERARVTIKIYNVAGQLVKTLIDDVRAPAAEYRVIWDGRNNQGEPAASGVYFCRLVTKGFSDTRKMVLLK